MIDLVDEVFKRPEQDLTLCTVAAHRGSALFFALNYVLHSEVLIFSQYKKAQAAFAVFSFESRPSGTFKWNSFGLRESVLMVCDRLAHHLFELFGLWRW